MITMAIAALKIRIGTTTASNATSMVHCPANGTCGKIIWIFIYSSFN